MRIFSKEYLNSKFDILLFSEFITALHQEFPLKCMLGSTKMFKSSAYSHCN